MDKRTILVTGAASGLGLALAKALSQKHPHNTIYALDRQECPVALQRSPNIKYTELDVTNEAQIQSFAETLDGEHAALDLVIHSAGVRGLVPGVPIAHSDDVADAETWAVMDARTMSLAFQVNALGFFLLMQALMPSLRRGAAGAATTNAQGLDAPPGGARDDGGQAKVVVLGSRMGSIGHNTSLGRAYAYRASKAALNAIVRSFAVDVPEVVWVIVHPGRVETGLVAVKEEGAMSVDEAVADLLPLVDRLGRRESGQFVDRFGVDIPW